MSNDVVASLCVLIVILVVLAVVIFINSPSYQEWKKAEYHRKVNEARWAKEREDWAKEQEEQRQEQLAQRIHEYDLRKMEERWSGQGVRAELASDRSIAWRVFARDNHRCTRCGTDGTEPRNDLTVDHVIPVSRGGTNVMSNLVTLCRSCNSRKGARL